MHTFTALALGLSLIRSSTARVAHDSAAEVQERDDENRVLGWFNRLVRKGAQSPVERRQDDGTCYIDEFYNFVNNSPFGEQYCQKLMNYPPVTNVVDYTSTSTSSYLYTTIVGTTRTTIYSTPVTTITVTRVGGKRDAAPEPTPAPRDVSNADIAYMFNEFRRQNAANATSSIPDPAMTASFISACGCQTYGGTTTTSTSTHAPVIVTKSRFGRSTQTIATTVVGATSSATVTVGPSGSVDSTTPAAAPPPSSVATSGPEPTAPAFSCPEDNNSTTSQMVGAERYDYLVLCDTEIMDPDSFNDFNYGTFSECAAACSVGNDRLHSPACQGFTYYASPNSGGYNCFLKPTVNQTVPAFGIDSAILRRIAVAVSNEDPEGTSTEAGPFAEPSLDPSEVSSAFDSALDGSSTSISVITPGPIIIASGLLVNGPFTGYSTYVSDGTTYSSGTGYSTYVSTNGSWYSNYYSTFTLAWSSAATVYGFSNGGTSVTNTTNSQSSQQSNADGSYVITTTTETTGYDADGNKNTTTVIGTGYYAANGTMTSTTATTSWTIETGSAGGSNGGAGGAGVITSTYPGSSWSSIIINSGGTAFVTSGAASGQVAQSTIPITSVTTIVSSFATAWSSVSSGVISGVISGGGEGGGAGGGTGGAGSTEISTLSGTLIPISSTLFSTGVGGVISGGASGIIASSGSPVPISSTLFSTGIGGEISGGASGFIPSSGASPTPLSSTLFSTGIGGAISGGASGVIPSSETSPTPLSSTFISGGTAFATSGFGSGSIPNSSSPYTNSEGNRSATDSTTLPLPSASLPTASLPIGTGSSGLPFTTSLGSRSGTFPPSGTAPSFTPLASTITSGGTAFVTSGFGSGAVSSSGSRFTNSEGNRSFTGSTTTPGPSASLPTGPAGYSPPTFTQSIPVPPLSNSLATRSGSLPSSGSLPGPSGYPPFGTGPSASLPAPSSGVPFSNSLGTRSGTLPLSGTAQISTGGPSGYPPFNTAPSASLPTPSSGFPFTNSLGTRSGTLPPSGSGPAAPTGTSPSPSSGFPPYPTAPSSCVINYLGTTTMFMTVTEFGCYSTCAPETSTTTEFGCYSNCVPAGGYGSSPLTFGPPSFGSGARPSYKKE